MFWGGHHNLKGLRFDYDETIPIPNDSDTNSFNIYKKNLCMLLIFQ